MKLIVCQKDKCKGIHAELVGDKLLDIQKRKTDRHPMLLKVTGSSFDVISSCTLCGTDAHIECVDGKINLDNLKIVETKEETDGEELKDTEDNSNEDDSNES